ncbi:hypothetical protein [Acinetobacter baumannii]|uniref:hypothetical protein n=1 Tax=Acinetobacter baumannii TaxID=470 RepID=UPI003F52866D
MAAVCSVVKALALVVLDVLATVVEVALVVNAMLVVKTTTVENFVSVDKTFTDIRLF